MRVHHTRAHHLPLVLLLLGLCACGTDDKPEGQQHTTGGTNNTSNNVRVDPPVLNNSTGDMGDMGEVDTQRDMGHVATDMGGLGDMGASDMGGPVDMGGPTDMGDPPDMASADMGPADMGPADMGPADMGPPASTCLSELGANSTFALNPSGPGGQYYARARFDGRGVWVAWSQREAAGVSREDVWAARYACDGSALVAPFRVNLTANVRDLQPVLALSDTRVFIFWDQEDVDAGNVHKTKLRTFSVDGTPKTAQEVDVTPTLGDGTTPLSTLIWELDAVALPSDQAAFAGSYWDAASSRFQVFVQRVDSGGGRVGAFIEPFANKSTDQKAPAIGATTNGTIHVTWTRQDGFAGAQQLRATTISPGASEAAITPPLTMAAGATDTFLPRYAHQAANNGRLYLAYQSDASSFIARVRDGDPSAPATAATLGQTSSLELRPDVAGGVGGGAVAWMRAVGSPARGEVRVQRFVDNAGSFSTQSMVTIPRAGSASYVRPAGNYGPSITHVGQNTYFVAWTEGDTAGDATVRGRFVQP